MTVIKSFLIGLLVTGGIHPLNDDVSNHHGCLVVPSKFSVLLYFSPSAACYGRGLLENASPPFVIFGFETKCRINALLQDGNGITTRNDDRSLQVHRVL